MKKCKQIFKVQRYTLAAFDALIFYFEGDNLATKNRRVGQFYDSLTQLSLPWIKELIPSYDSCLLEYDVFKFDHHQVLASLELIASERAVDNDSALPNRLHTLPVCYDESLGESDLNSIARNKNLTCHEVVKIHTGREYRVYAVGFQPGFAYLGELDARLESPRLSKPRLKVPRGSVAIADLQTSVYPNASPGGWHILGRCPIDLSQIALSDKAFKVGDSVRFEEIPKHQYLKLVQTKDKVSS